MKLLLRYLAGFGVLSLLLVLSAGAVQEQPSDEKGEFSEEQKTDEPAPPAKFFTRRFLKLKNTTEEKISASLFYKTSAAGTWAWLPGDPASGEPLAVELEPGQVLLVQVEEQPITASRLRIFGSSRSFKWDNNREVDLWTVPETDMEEHRYKATEMDTFLYTFSPPEGADQGEPVASEDKKSSAKKTDDDTESTPTPSEGETTPIGNNEAVAGGDNAPTEGSSDGGGASGGLSNEGAGGSGGEGVKAPLEFVKGLLEQFGKGKGGADADPGADQPKGVDLAALEFKLTLKGDFTGVIQNIGTEDYTSGRRWFVLKSTKGKVTGFDKALAQGDIDPLAPNAKQDLSGKIPAFTKTANYVLVLSPGDSNKKNDSSDVIKFTPASSKSDLSVAVTLVKGELQGVINNLGPEDFKGDGSRTFKLADKSGTVAPQDGKVPDIKKGESFKVKLDVKTALKFNTKFFLALNAGDEKPANDFAEVASKGKAFGPDLEAKTLILKGDKLEGTITNNGPGEYKGGRTAFLGNSAANKSEPIPPLKPGATHLVSLTVPKAVLASFQLFKLNISEIDGKPGNDSAKVEHKSKNAPDLAVSLSLLGDTLKGKITNQGPAAYDGKSRKFKLFHAGGVYQQAPVVKKLKSGEFVEISHKLPASTPAQTIVLELDKGDADVKNDKAEQKFAPTAADLAVILKIVGATVNVTVTNIGVDPFPGKRAFTLARAGLKDFAGFVPGPIAAKSSRSVSFSLAAMSKPGKVAFILAAGDPNPANDTASALFKLLAKGFDLDLDKTEFLAGSFVITISNKGLAPYAGGDPYTITGPGGFKETGKIPALAAAKPLSFTHKPKALPAAGVYTLTLNVKDIDPANNTRTVKIGTPAKGVDLLVKGLDFKAGAFEFSVVNKGPDPYAGGDPYTITGPGGFKEVGKIPALPSAKPVSFAHKPKVAPTAGIYTLTLNIKDIDPTGNTATVKVSPPKGFDLAISNILYNPKTTTFSFKVANKGPADYAGKDDTTITGPGGFKESGPFLPALLNGADITLSHKALAKTTPGIYTVTLNVKDADASNNSGKVLVAPPAKAELIIASMTKKGKTWSATIQNIGAGAYSSSDGVVFASRFIKKGKSFNFPDVGVPNLAPGASVTLPARPDPGVGATIEGQLQGGSGAPISTDPTKNKKTIK